MKISFIATVFNEEKTITAFLKSLKQQSKQPDEVIIVDAGSSDSTVSIISNFKFLISKQKVKIIIKKGNRSVGRNEAIQNSTGEIIACSDAGCELDRDFFLKITKPFKDEKVDVVSGFYYPVSKNIFEKCLGTYTSVMEDKIDSQNFLPSSRSVAFRKSAWKKTGGYPENLDTCEDLVFAQKLKEEGFKFKFVKEAFVLWKQKSNIFQAFKQFLSYARGDGKALFIRPRTPFLFLRYFLFFLILLYFFLFKEKFLLIGLIVLPILYLVWAFKKNYKYVKNLKALYILPVLQITSDIAVVGGMSLGLLERINLKNFYKKNKWAVVVASIYSIVMFSVINWGIPNANHPFTYHMDEWHQLQSVRFLFEKGTPNVEGAAHGPILQFLLSGFYLSFFALFKIINIFSLDQQKLFQILRINSLLFAILSIFLVSKISKDYLRIYNPIIPVLLFVFTPIWLSLSNYYKYDIALIFWILLSILFILSYIKKPTVNKYFLSAIPFSLALATKISALPLLPVYVLSFFFFRGKNEKIKDLLTGLGIYFFTFFLIGIPDVIFGKGDYREFLYSNLISSPKETFNLLLGMNHWVFLAVKQFPAIFGYPFYILFLASFFYLLFNIFKSLKNKNFYLYKNHFFFFISLLFFSVSLIPLKIGATGNRSLVLLPFFVFISAIFLNDLWKLNHKFYFYILISIVLSIQILESFSWVSIKLSQDPRLSSSIWIKENVQKGSVIGLENIPIYQMLPDIVLKEYYAKEKDNNNYKYQILESSSNTLPKIIIITNREFDENFVMESPKKSLITRLNKEGYMVTQEFYPDLKFNSLFNNYLNFYISALVPSSTITLYTKK